MQLVFYVMFYIKKLAGLDNLSPFFVHLAANIIAETMPYIFNLSMQQNALPEIWKCAFVLRLMKGDDSLESIITDHQTFLLESSWKAGE